MSNELNTIALQLQDVNKNINSIYNVIKGNEAKTINAKTNDINSNLFNSNNIANILISNGVVIKTGFTAVLTLLNNRNKYYSSSYKNRNNLFNENNKQLPKLTNNKELLKLTYNKQLPKLETTFFKKGIAYFSKKQKDENKNDTSSLFSKTVSKTKEIGNSVIDKTKSGFQKGGTILDGLSLVGLGLYGLYTTFNNKIGKWTGTINLISKNFLRIGSKILNPFKKMGSLLLSPFKKMGSLLLSQVKTLGKFLLSPFKTLGKTITKDVGKTALKTVSKTAIKDIGKNVLKDAGKSLLKKIPGVSFLVGLGFGIKRVLGGDLLGGLLEIASGIAGSFPLVGTALSIGIDVFLAKRDYNNTKKGKTFKPLNFSHIWSVIENKLKHISWDKLPVIGGFINMGKSFNSLFKGNFKNALKNDAMGIFDMFGLSPILSLLTSHNTKNIIKTSTIAKTNITDTLNKNLNKHINKHILQTKQNLDSNFASIDKISVASSSYNDKYLAESKKEQKYHNEKMDKIQDIKIKLQKKQLDAIKTQTYVLNSLVNNNTIITTNNASQI